MTHIQSHKNKLFQKQLSLFIFMILIVVIFIFTFGFKILFGTSLFINQIFNKDNSQLSPTRPDFFGEISIDSIPEATNSASILVTGSVDQFDQITVYLNDNKVDEIKIANSSFSMEIKDLQKGENKLYFVAKSNKFKEKKQTENFQVLYGDEKPKLEITEPADQLKTLKNEIKVVGNTAKENTVKINSSPVVVDMEGNFETSIKLKNGENKIVITVTDNFGSFEEKTVTVIKEE